MNKDNVSIAVEIETGASDYIAAIIKDLKATYDLVISVAANESVEKRIREKLEERKPDKIKRIKVTTVKAFE